MSEVNSIDVDGFFLGKHVIVRTQSAGVWFGVVEVKKGREVILRDARRMYYWQANKSVSLSGVALYGVDHNISKICAPVSKVWLEAIELILPADLAAATIVLAPEVEAS